MKKTITGKSYKNSILIFVLILLASIASPKALFAESEIDSLETLLPFANDIQRIDILNALAFQLKGINNQKSLDYATQAYHLSRKLKYEKGEANAHIIFGINKKNKSDYKGARYEYLLALKQSLNIRDTSTIAFAFYSLGNLYNLESNYSKSLRYYLITLHLSEKINDQKRIAKTLNNIGAIYLDLKNYSKAEQYYLRAYDLEKSLNSDELTLAELGNNLANIYLIQGYNHKSLFYYKQSLEVFRKLGSSNDIATALNNIATVYIDRKQEKLALKNIYEAVELNEKYDDKLGLIYSYSNLSKAHLLLKHNDSAEYYALKSNEIAKNSHFKNEYLTTIEDLSILYEKFGNKEKAYFYLRLSKSEEEKIKGAEETSKIADIQSNYTNLKKTEEINHLTKVKQKQAQEIHDKDKALEQRNTYILFLSLGIILIVLIFITVVYIIQLNRKRKEVEQISIRKSNIIDKINTELRDPLNAVLGYSTLASESKNIKDLRDHLSRIQNAGTDLLFVMNNIIHYMEVESGQSKTYPISFNLTSFLTNILKSFQKQCSSSGILFYQMVFPEVPEEIICDRSKIQSIILNLLQNAIQHSGSAIIRFEMSAGEIYEKDGKRKIPIKLRIQDEGIGIDQNIVKNPGRPFHTIKGRKEKSRGIGLYLINHFVQSIGGKMQISSQANQGTEILIQWDCQIVQKPNAFQIATNETHQKTFDILLAQPNNSTEHILTRFLEAKNHRCKTVVNGLEALENIHTQPFDVLIIEIDLAEINGLELVKKIKKDPGIEINPEMKIIALSTISSEDTIQLCLKEGFDFYLVKPVMREELYAVLEEILKVNPTD